GLPLRAWRSASVRVSEAISPLERVPVWSTTRPVSGGTASSARAGTTQPTSSARRTALAAFIAACRLFRRRRRWIEVDLRCDRNFLLVVDREIRLFLVAERHSGQIVRKGADADVIFMHRLDVVVARL